MKHHSNRSAICNTIGGSLISIPRPKDNTAREDLRDKKATASLKILNKQIKYCPNDKIQLVFSKKL